MSRLPRSPLARKRMLARRKPVRRIPRGLGNRVRKPNVYSFKRTVYVPQWATVNALGDQPFKLEPKLSDLPNYTEFTALFDQYRIKGVSFKLIPRYNVVPQTSGNPLLPTQVMSVLDYDGTGPNTLTAIRQYQTLRTTRNTSIHKRYFKPAILQMVYESSTTTAYGPKWNQWIDCNNDTVPHYGLYGICPQIASGVSDAEYFYDLEAVYYIQCKTVR